MRILYRSVQNYSSVEYNTFFKERGMLGPYNTSDSLITIVIVSLIVIVVPILLLLFLYIIIVRSDLLILWPLRLLYIERRFYHLNHLIIVHLCNVKEVFPSKRLISKSLIYLFFYFESWLYTTHY